MLLKALSKQLPNSVRAGAVTTSLESLFQRPATPWVKNLVLTPRLGALSSCPRYPSLSKWRNRRKGLRTTSVSLLLGLLPSPSRGNGRRDGPSVPLSGAALAAGRAQCGILAAPPALRAPTPAGLELPVFPFQPIPGFAIVSPRNQPSPQTPGQGWACAGPGEAFALLGRSEQHNRRPQLRVRGFLAGEDQPGFGLSWTPCGLF